MIKTLNLTANTETSVSNLGGDRCRIQNRTSGTLYVSDKPGITPCADGVMSIPSGRGDYFPYSMVSDTVYLLSESGGNVEVSGEHYYRPFDSAAVTGGKAVGNPVVIDGLQGGVPFSEIMVSGEDISGKELTLVACGKNLIPYPYFNTTKTTNGITFTDNGDGSITVNGTATSTAQFFLSSQLEMLLPAGSYALSGTPDIDDTPTFNTSASLNIIEYHDNEATSSAREYGRGTNVTLSGNATGEAIYIRVPKGVTCDNIVFKPQLELGAAATDYEPYSGAEYKLTPDSNPYTVPNDIRQVEGRNTLYIADSGAQLAVTYAKTNPALSRVYKSIDALSTALVALGAEN